ncbi:MAG: transglycosylase domain-containing protein [Chloroflexia bacterium]|nr:transglycosylase domain-containing protein [Chloroflexia bacterium]
MTHGRISRASQRYPDAKRRAARYGNTRYGRRAKSLPPQLMPGVTSRDKSKKPKFLGGPIAIFSMLGVVALVVGIVVLVITVISSALGVAGTMAAYREVNKDLPNAAEVAVDTFQTTRIYDRNGVLLQEVDNPNAGWRNFVPLDQVADDFINATVSAEDSTFWTNDGVEPYAIVRGALINVSGAGSSGGSTITQQLVRAVYPEQISGLDISYTRKGREALAAVALAQQYSKTDILTMYVNQIYYGNRAYGIEAAANTYFDKRASDLTLAESSYLAGLPQSPTYYAELFDQAKIRQQYVLDQMVTYRYITRAEADAAFAEPLNPGGPRSGAVLDAPHFTQYVREYIVENYGEEALYGGLEITTSIDLELQNRAEQLLRSGVAEMEIYERNNGAMVIMVPWSGEVLAMVGSADFGNALINGEVNYATSLIQPGSSMKPIVYAAAFENGLNPGSVLLDVPTEWENPGEAPYAPQNYTDRFYGAISVREALANSLNIPAVKATEFVGVQEVMDTAREMGMIDSLEEEASYYGLSIGLGAAEVELLEHTNAYATLANNGANVPPHPIIEIKDSQGNVLYSLDDEQIAEDSTQAIPSGNAYQVTSILSDNEAREMIFRRGNLFEQTQQQLGRPTAAKSGTTDDWKDLWTMGYTTDVAIGVWVGVSGGANTVGLQPLDGSEAAGPIWQRMMVEMHDDPAFAALLNGPDGNPLPEQFAVPEDAYQGEICATTGHQPGRGSTTEEWLVRGQGPDLACGELSDWEREQLEDAIAATRERGVSWNDNAINSIAQYASAAGVGGIRVQEDERRRPGSDSNNGDEGDSGDNVPIEGANDEPGEPSEGNDPDADQDENGQDPPPDDEESSEPVIEPAD